MLANPNPTVAAATDPPATPGGSQKNFAATVTVQIAGEIFTLSGKLDTGSIVVEYHKPFDQAISLGSLDTIAEQIGTALNFTDLTGIINTAHDDLAKLPVLGEIVNAIETATIRITDLVINTATKTYGIGLALDFTTSNPLPQLFGITLVSLGFSVTSVNKGQKQEPGSAPGA